MEKILVICNTYFQLITAIQLRKSILKHEYVVVLLSDHSNNADTIVSRLKKINCFDEVYYIETKQTAYGTRTLVKEIRRTVYAIIGKKEPRIDVLDNIAFDRVMYYNLNLCTVSILGYICKIYPNISCDRFEEGIISYGNKSNDGLFNTPSKRLKMIAVARKVLNKKNNIFEKAKHFYCYYPEYYSGNHSPQAIPLLTENSETLELLTQVFNIDRNDLNYKEKYIYFASLCDFEGKEPIGEIKLVEEIARIVGKDNLLIKIHPRDDTNTFERMGLHVDKHSDIPWEAIQLNYDFSKHVFLTAISTSIVSVNLLLKDRPKSYFLYPLCNISNNKVVRMAVDSLEELFSKIDKDTLQGIKIIDNLENIFEE